jgi:hypothetical protein
MPYAANFAVRIVRLRAERGRFVQTAQLRGYILWHDCESASPAIPLLTDDLRITDLITPNADSGVAVGDFRHEL